MPKPTVITYLTNGVGNNLFQYVYARLVAEAHGARLSIYHNPGYYGIDFLKAIGIKITKFPPEDFPKILIRDGQGLEPSLGEKYHGHNFVINGFHEDYTFYKSHLPRIKSWFIPIPKTNTKDLVLHLRLGDRLLYHRDFTPGMRPSPQEFIQATKNFQYKRLHIVTDMPRWGPITEKQLDKMKFHRKVKPSMRIEPKKSVNYMNSLVEELKPLNPIVQAGNNIVHDFNYIRSFDKILFQHSTLAWWAAVLSEAGKIGVYGPWRPVKGDGNKNLGKTNYRGWFSWGSFKS